MNPFLLAAFLILPVLAGALLAFYTAGRNQKGLKLLLSFGGAYLLGISFLHLIPEIYIPWGNVVGLFVLAGFLLQLLLEFLSQGIEHGHTHSHAHTHEAGHGHGFPVLIFISLCLHAFIEAVPLEREVHHEHYGSSGISLLVAIAIHNIPLTVALTATLLCYHLSKTKTLVWVLVFACCGPLGAFFGRLFYTDLIQAVPAFFDYAMGLVIGMFLHISTTILFESSEGHRFNAVKLLAVLSGFAVSILSSLV